MSAPVGSPAWYAWLETATTFRFEGAEGTFTAHKERAGNRRGDWYWRAYRRQHRQLSRYYLGVSANLTPSTLQEAARHLATRPVSAVTKPETSGRQSALRGVNAPAVVTPLPILHAKLVLPRLPAQHVSRPRLLALLEQGVQRPLTLVSAPAGFGKTSLLAEWARTTDRPVAWLACEPADNDPARFLAYLLAALGRLETRATTVAAAGPSWFTRDDEAALIASLNELEQQLQSDAVLILDDYHLITTDSIHHALRFLLEHVPARLHLVIGTRADPPWPLARWRTRHQLSALLLEELRFVSAEVAAFASSMGLQLSADALRLLQARTEGWGAGLQLLALVLRTHPDPVAFLESSGGAHRFLLEYVSEEVLAQQPVEMQRFLLRTSFLERLTGPLCDAVTGESGGGARLEEALRANLFVSALDGTQTWYRYHPLFAEALQAHLHKLESELAPALYRRASSWYERQQGEEACHYALLAGDHARAATLLESLIPHLLEQGKFLQMRSFLAHLSPALVDASPTLWVASVSLPMLRTGIQGTSEQTMRTIIERIEQRLRALEESGDAAWEELRAGLPIMRAIAALVQGDPTRASTLANEIPPASSHSGSALSRFIAVGRQGVLGAAYGASEDLAAAEQLFFAGDAAGSGEAAQPRNLSVAASLSELYEARGQLRKLGRFYDDLFRELSRTDAPGSPVLLALMQARYALLLYEWNRLAEAGRAVRQSEEVAGKLEASHPIVPGLRLLNCWTRARLALARGERRGVEDLLEHAELNLSARPGVAKEQRLPDALRARLALTCGQLEPALRWAETCGLRFDGVPVPGDYAGLLALARVLFVQGCKQHEGVRLTQAAFLLNRLRDLALEQGWQGRLREIEVLTALTLQAQGKTKRALATLGAVLAQAEPEGYIRLFADEGPPMAHLLAAIAAYTSASAGYIQQIRAASAQGPRESPETAPPAFHQPLPDPLSPREQEVLQLIARGFSNQQIADQLVISLHTAKRHVRHLLAKLVVTNRIQALARARELHLL